MKIDALEFTSGDGARFVISAVNLTERVLLCACVGVKSNLQETGDDCDKFYLTLPVSNS